MEQTEIFTKYFTIIEVTESLFQNGLTIVGMKKNIYCIPQNVKANKPRSIKTCIFRFKKNMRLILSVSRIH